ncbi:hypothetical protein ACXIZN_41615 [Amycolatopsis sp. TRM77291]
MILLFAVTVSLVVAESARPHDGGTSSVAPIFFSISGVVFVAMGSAFLVWVRRRESPPREVTFRDRVKAVKSHLESSGNLLRELEDDLATRTAILEQRQAEADRYEKLASLNEAQAKAVEDLVGRQFERQDKASAIYWWSGIAIAFVLGLVVNWISGPLWAWITR